MLKLIKEVVTNVFRKPVTIQYPYERPEVTRGLRGRHYPDLSKCIGCSLCFVDCPANAIKMVKLPKPVKKNPRGIYPIVDYGKCVFCYQCVFVCPVKAYVTTTEFELAGESVENSNELSLKTLPPDEEVKTQ